MSLPCPFTLHRASVVSHCWRPGTGEPSLTCCICSFMLWKLLVFPSSDLLGDSSTAGGVSSDIQLFCISKSSLSSKPGSIRDFQGFRPTYTKREHYIQVVEGARFVMVGVPARSACLSCLSLPQISCRFSVIPQGLTYCFSLAETMTGTSPLSGCQRCLSSSARPLRRRVSILGVV